MADIDRLYAEIEQYYIDIEDMEDGEHLIDRYARVKAILVRVAHIRSQMAMAEIKGTADAADKKFRTMILDPFIERLQEVCRYESRALTAKEIEAKMEK